MTIRKTSQPTKQSTNSLPNQIYFSTEKPNIQSARLKIWSLILRIQFILDLLKKQFMLDFKDFCSWKL